MAAVRIAVQTEDFDMAHEYTRLRDDAGNNGAVVTFTGLVRELANGELEGMHLEHYPGMTERALADIATQAQQRWPIANITIIHRVGYLTLNEQIVLVGVASAHRKAAFAAAEFIMDFLKTSAPFWKKEHSAEGAHWVEAKASDADAARQWQRDDE